MCIEYIIHSSVMDDIIRTWGYKAAHKKVANIVILDIWSQGFTYINKWKFTYIGFTASWEKEVSFQ